MTLEERPTIDEIFAMSEDELIKVSAELAARSAADLMDHLDRLRQVVAERTGSFDEAEFVLASEVDRTIYDLNYHPDLGPLTDEERVILHGVTGRLRTQIIETMGVPLQSD